MDGDLEYLFESDMNLLDAIMILEAKEESSIISYLVNEMQHLIKYQCMPHKQTKSWVNTILNCNLALLKYNKNKFPDDSELDDLYKVAINEAKKEEIKFHMIYYVNLHILYYQIY